MAIVVEHDKRKREILDKALDVFVEEGYEDVTFQKLAARCGITRTTLYIYFRNKQEIFLWSIKQLTQGIEESLTEIITHDEYSSKEKLQRFCTSIVDMCLENKKLFNIVLMYLMQIKKAGKDPGEKVRRRIIRLRHLLSNIIIDGIKKSEFKEISVKAANDMFYSLILSTIFRLAILDQKTVEEVYDSFYLAIDGLLA
ncbi:MAG TPA: TetR/AcrR family transcriptional regulator [Treponemataceae bacterium]|nr:TetR/AcrR family transcriptional regulator [Treponemataceae bacterium]HOQ92393.1 TetR/AcrR family transcriptional regulator [Treponemataceae bacterium]HPM05559.1 TetR/AcrR family transcriptional regulator [Treponemataceae bacterium]